MACRSIAEALSYCTISLENALQHSTEKKYYLLILMFILKEFKVIVTIRGYPEVPSKPTSVFTV